MRAQHSTNQAAYCISVALIRKRRCRFTIDWDFDLYSFSHIVPYECARPAFSRRRMCHRSYTFPA